MAKSLIAIVSRVPIETSAPTACSPAITTWVDKTEDKSMVEVLNAQKVEADASFSDFVINNYEDWISDPEIDRPLLSHNLLKQKVFRVVPLLTKESIFVF